MTWIETQIEVHGDDQIIRRVWVDGKLVFERADNREAVPAHLIEFRRGYGWYKRLKMDRGAKL